MGTEEKAFSTIKVYLAEMYTCHIGFGDKLDGQHCWTVCCFMAGVWHKLWVSKPLVPLWDFSLVLEVLHNNSFKMWKGQQKLVPGNVETIGLCYRCRETEPPIGVKAHSTGSMATLLALFHGVSVQDNCTAVRCATPHTFVHFYRLSNLLVISSSWLDVEISETAYSRFRIAAVWASGLS